MLGHHRFAPNSVPYQKSKSWTTLPKHHAAPCADPGIFVSGGPGHLTNKALTTLFSISKKTIIFQGSRGGPTFSGGGGVQLLIPYRNPYNVIFQGVRTPVPPLWILTASPKRFFILKSANGITVVTRGFY